MAALIGADALVARIREWRSWPRDNAWLAPAALILVSLPITAVFLAGAAANAIADGRRMDGLAQTLPAALELAGVARDAPLISDHPIWLSDALHRAVIVLPEERPSSLVLLAGDFSAGAVVVTEPRGDFPALLRTPGAAGCFTELSVPGMLSGSAVFVVSEACR